MTHKSVYDEKVGRFRNIDVYVCDICGCEKGTPHNEIADTTWRL